MTIRKYNAMMDNYTGHKGQTTVDHIQSFIPATLFNRLTGAELGMMMSAIDKAYKAGFSAAGAELIDDKAVYINNIGMCTFAPIN